MFLFDCRGALRLSAPMNSCASLTGRRWIRLWVKSANGCRTRERYKLHPAVRVVNNVDTDHRSIGRRRIRIANRRRLYSDHRSSLDPNRTRREGIIVEIEERRIATLEINSSADDVAAPIAHQLSIHSSKRDHDSSRPRWQIGIVGHDRVRYIDPQRLPRRYADDPRGHTIVCRGRYLVLRVSWLYRRKHKVRSKNCG